MSLINVILWLVLGFGGAAITGQAAYSRGYWSWPNTRPQRALAVVITAAGPIGLVGSAIYWAWGSKP